MMKLPRLPVGSGASEQGAGNSKVGPAGPANIMQTELGNGGMFPQRAAADKWARESNAMIRHSQQLERDSYVVRRMRMTSEALIAIANHLAGFPGRKNLVWISGGFPSWNLLMRIHPSRFGIASSENELHSQSIWVSRTVKALNNVNLAIYPVDARGVRANANAETTAENITSGEADLHSDSITAMKTLARRAGGQAIYNTNNIAGAIRQVVDSSKVTYTLAYYPKGVRWNDEHRKIKVLVNRSGTHLQYRDGYIALSEKERPTVSANAALGAVVASLLDATGVGFTVRMFRDGNAKSVQQGPFFIHYLVDMHDITFRLQGGHWDARVTLVTDELGPKSENLKSVSLEIGLHLKPDAYNRFLAKGLGFRQRVPFSILPSAARLRIVIRDDATGTIGSVSVPLGCLMHRLGSTFVLAPGFAKSDMLQQRASRCARRHAKTLGHVSRAIFHLTQVKGEWARETSE